MHLLDLVARRLGGPLRALVAAGAAVLGLWLVISTLHDRHEPTLWGTFTATRCATSGHQGMECSGRWVGDDGHTVLDEAYLYQEVAIGTPVRAGVTTTGWGTSIGEHEVFTHRGGGWTWVLVGLAATAWSLWQLTHLLPRGEPPVDERRDACEPDAPPRRAL